MADPPPHTSPCLCHQVLNQPCFKSDDLRTELNRLIRIAANAPHSPTMGSSSTAKRHKRSVLYMPPRQSTATERGLWSLQRATCQPQLRSKLPVCQYAR